MSYQLPLPTNELWRRTRPDKFSFPAAPPSALPDELLSDNDIGEGIHITTLMEGRSEFKGLLKNIHADVHTNDLVRYSVNNAENGFLVYVEPGVKCEKPIELKVHLSRKDNTVLRNTIILGAGADIKLIELVKDPGGVQLVTSTRMVLSEGSILQYRRLWNWRRSVYSNSSITVGRNARLDAVSLNLGTGVSKIEQKTKLAGEGARLEELFVDVCREKSHFDLFLEVDHAEPDTYSRMETLGVVRDRSYSLHHGLVKILPGADGSDSYLKSKHLLLSENARADSIPKLEIGTDAVTAGHGHTLGDVDPEAIFYLMNRGISRNEAEEMYVDGFLAPLFERFPELTGLMGCYDAQ